MNKVKLVFAGSRRVEQFVYLYYPVTVNGVQEDAAQMYPAQLLDMQIGETALFVPGENGVGVLTGDEAEPVRTGVLDDPASIALWEAQSQLEVQEAVAHAIEVLLALLALHETDAKRREALGAIVEVLAQVKCGQT